MARPATTRRLFDFPDATALAGWEIVNDTVMGGRSHSRLTVENALGVFAGEVSRENSGGFASVRSRPQPLATEATTGFYVRVRGDGHRFKFTARQGETFDGVVYQQRFAAPRGSWVELWLAYREFIPPFRGRTLTGVPALLPGQVSSVGFLIADGQEGPFRLEIAWIEVATAPPGL